MVNRIKTVGELRALIADKSDNAPLMIAPTPDINGYVSSLLAMVGTIDGHEDAVVLALGEESEDVDPVFPHRPV